MKIMDTDNARLLIGIAAALGTSFLVGLFNYGLIRILRIPPIIATLSSSFLILSTAISYGRGIRIKPPPLARRFRHRPLLRRTAAGDASCSCFRLPSPSSSSAPPMAAPCWRSARIRARRGWPVSMSISRASPPMC